MVDEAVGDNVHAALQGSALVPLGGVLTAFIVIGIYIDINGQQQMVRVTHEDIEAWQYDGLLHHALFNWPMDEGQDLE